MLPQGCAADQLFELERMGPILCIIIVNTADFFTIDFYY